MGKIAKLESTPELRPLLDDMRGTGEPVLVTEAGQPVAAVMDYAEFERLTAELHRLRAVQRFSSALEDIEDPDLKGDLAEALLDARKASRKTW